jgi:hypothetical protein
VSIGSIGCKRGFFPDGIPVHDTIAWVISQLNPKQFQQFFANWVQNIWQRTYGQLIAIDGKTLKGNWQKGERGSAHNSMRLCCWDLWRLI